jgi:hypothetical protein
MAVSEIQLFNILKSKMGDAKAQSLVEFVKTQVDDSIETKKGIFLTKDDKVDLMKAIYLVGIVQFLAIVGSVIATVNFMIK